MDSKCVYKWHVIEIRSPFITVNSINSNWIDNVWSDCEIYHSIPSTIRFAHTFGDQLVFWQQCDNKIISMREHKLDKKMQHKYIATSHYELWAFCVSDHKLYSHEELSSLLWNLPLNGSQELKNCFATCRSGRNSNERNHSLLP